MSASWFAWKFCVLFEGLKSNLVLPLKEEIVNVRKICSVLEKYKSKRKIWPMLIQPTVLGKKKKKKSTTLTLELHWDHSRQELNSLLPLFILAFSFKLRWLNIDPCLSS